MKKIINNIPNMITVSRIISCLFGATFFTMGNIPVALGCYIYGAISDAIDGFVARKLNAITELGKKLDPISDKLYALSLMVPSIILGNYFMLIPFAFEGIISGINVYSNIKYKKTYTEKVGKLKTVLLFPTMILGLLVTQYPNLIPLFLPSFIISSNLQAKSIVAYTNQLNTFEKLEEENVTTEISNEINNDYLNDRKISEELNESFVRKDVIYKNKKLVRKKDYNDRY